jgi:hypothetical protein
MDARNRRSSTWNNLRAGLMAACVCAAGLGLCAAASAAPAPDAPGTWQSHQITFSYLGFSTTYSCNGLRDRLTFLLQQSGARLDSPVLPESCVHGAGRPTKLISARLHFSTLQPGGSGGGSTAGSWHHVEFSSTRSYPQLHGADCELVREFQTKVLTAFDIRDVHANLHCLPYQASSHLFALSFQVFAPKNAGPRQIGGG